MRLIVFLSRMLYIPTLSSNLLLLLLSVFIVDANIFADTLCMSSALKATGKFEDVSTCARKCVSTNGCQSFFYDSEELDCFTVDVVLTSTAGCDTKSGVNYFINSPDNVAACYDFTSEDNDGVSQGVSVQEQCESRMFNVYTGGNNEDYPGCGDCTCCKQKGSLHGNSRTYNGSWSKTNTGRECQRWDSQTPHYHYKDYDSYYPLDNSIHDAHNYCRDPDYEGFPWCYTIDPDVRWEACGILLCAMTQYKFVQFDLDIDMNLTVYVK